MVDYRFIFQVIVPMRSKPSDASEMVSQLLFGELVAVLAKDRQWLHVRNESDQYEGWIDEKACLALEPSWLSEEKWQFLGADCTKAALVSPNSQLPLRLTRGSRIPGSAQIGTYKLAFLETPIFEEANGLEGLLANSENYLGAPYLWGGKTIWGIDCSGFTQVLFAMAGIAIPRDAAQQAKVGKPIEFGRHKAGDLAFFENKEGKVTHVGLLINENEIRHASGTVHDDWFRPTGIFSKDTEKQSHTLCSIKRFL